MAVMAVDESVVQRYRAQFQTGRVQALRFTTPSALSGDPESVGRIVIEMLDAKAEFEARALADTYLSPEARKAISAALLEETRVGLGLVAERVREGINARRETLQPALAPAMTDTAKLARQIELQRGEQRLAQLAGRSLQPADIVARSDGPMLDALEAAPKVFLGNGLPMDQVREMIKSRRYEIADSGERAVFDKLQKLERQQQRIDALMAAADYEAEHSLGDSGIRPASVWSAS